MRNLVRGEYFPKISNKVLSHYGQLFCDPNTIEDGDVVYCDTHSIVDFRDCLNKKNNLTIITHNSDHYICDGTPWNGNGISTDEFTCYKKWYGQNSYSIKENVIPIPIGFENIRWESCFGSKTEWLSQVLSEEIQPSSLVYFNCNKSTNILERENCFNFCKTVNFITVDEPNLSYLDYLRYIKNHKFVLSPRGNGLDCHRTWEVLMLGRIPILKREGQLERLYKDMPVLFVDEWDDLLEVDLECFYNQTLFKNQGRMYFDYWSNFML